MSLFGSYNHITLLGRMTRDPEVRTTGNGRRVLGFSLAVSESVKKGDKWEDEVTYVDCTAWEKTAEFFEKFGGKGKLVLIDGRLRTEKWKDKQTGDDRSKLSVVVNSVTFCDGKDKGGDEPRRGGGRGADRGPVRGGDGSSPYAEDDSDF